MLKGAADGGLCSAYGAGIGVGNDGVGGCDGYYLCQVCLVLYISGHNYLDGLAYSFFPVAFMIPSVCL